MAVVFELCDQDAACRKLLSAVVALALQDSCMRPNQSGKTLTIKNDALSGLHFLFGHGGFFMELLDIDPDEFCKRLVARMYSSEWDSRFSEDQKRSFRWNYSRYLQLETSIRTRSDG